MTTAAEERDHWDALARGDAAAEVWSEPEWEAGIARCLAKIEDGLAPVFDRSLVTHGLDLGCGIGRLTIPMADRHPLMRIWGVDISQRMLDLAAQRAETDLRPDHLMPQGRPRSIHWVLGDGRYLPFTSRLDAIWSVVTMQHIPFPAQGWYVGQMYSTLKPRGRAVIQFVEGSDSSPMNHHVTVPLLKQMFAGFRHVTYDVGDVFPNWIWVTAEK